MGFEIWFVDLKEETQKEFLKFMEMQSADEGNLYDFPITVIPKPEKEEE